MKIKIVISGRSYHRATQVPEYLELSDDSTVEDALKMVAEILGEELSGSTLVAIGEKHLGTVARHPATDLQPNDELVLISPVAGG